MNRKSHGILLSLLLAIATSLSIFPSVAATKPLTQSQALAKWDGDKFPATGLWLLEDFNLGFNESSLSKVTTTNGITIAAPTPHKTGDNVLPLILIKDCRMRPGKNPVHGTVPISRIGRTNHHGFERPCVVPATLSTSSSTRKYFHH